ncbi:MAG: hypothetical protein HY074_02785 [Deltaproteobacteria bacterium]|nr:hypothetical protein [Deltaproteobacteria bacterium]
MAQTVKDNRILILVNPASGNGRGEELLKGATHAAGGVMQLAERCQAGSPSDWPVVHTTKDGAWKIEVEAYLRTRGLRTVMVIGGDGTLMEAASLLYSLRALGGLSMIPIPGGRGNDFSRTFYGYSLEQGDFWEWAANSIEREGRQWKRCDLDLASANGKLFINMASIGYGGKVVENAQNRKAFWSKTSLVYQVEGVLAMTSGAGGSCNVKVDGKSVYMGPFFGAFVGNGQANGSGLYWTTGARFDDGKIDGIVFPKPGMLDMIRTMSAIKAKEDPPMRHTDFQGAEIVFHFDRPTALELDGDYMGNALSHELKCLPNALNSWVLKK